MSKDCVTFLFIVFVFQVLMYSFRKMHGLAITCFYCVLIVIFSVVRINLPKISWSL